MAGVTKKRSTWNSCWCSAYIAHEMRFDLRAPADDAYFGFPVAPNAGDMDDEVILRNRSLFDPEAVLVAVA